MAESQQDSLTTLTVDLLAAFVSNNNVRAEDLPGLISSTHTALAGLGGEGTPETEPAPDYTPAVTARKSLASPDHIVSMIDGKSYKSLKRHLSSHGMTPTQYRERYKLPVSYPMVAPAYSEQRREVAKRLGLGRKREAGAAAAKPARGGRRPRRAKDEAPS